ncbi:hypothetical protein FTO74_14425 [Granulicella sp. WH15]|uniref:hypothetical protein n=1 Tax=Granulicella sp. WH15 TaxID=2602070 RepID=UPI001367786C|nr:hypothetical protein [Granulicella sp. WH15]QHN04428.1 hypothetical protein FTO74_14425 [Granulicella sp. WH15]
MSETQEVLLDLAKLRIIRLHDRNRSFTLFCRRIERADWLAYFAAIRITSEQTGAKRANTMDFETPRVMLAERVLLKAEGYKVAGFDKLEDVPNWQSRLPLSHRRQLGATLANVRSSEASEDFVIHAEAEEVLLDAAWSAVHLIGDSWAMNEYQGLKHILKTPTDAQYKRYNQESSRSIVVGGSRSGKTIYTGAHAVLCDLYDELILSVEGYSVDGKPLTSVEQIRAEMDLHHKFSAAQELFNPNGTVSTEAAEQE